MVMPNPPGPDEWKNMIKPKSNIDNQGLLPALAPRIINSTVTKKKPNMDNFLEPNFVIKIDPKAPPVIPNKAFTTALPPKAAVSSFPKIPPRVSGR